MASSIILLTRGRCLQVVRLCVRAVRHSEGRDHRHDSGLRHSGVNPDAT